MRFILHDPSPTSILLNVLGLGRLLKNLGPRIFDNKGNRRTACDVCRKFPSNRPWTESPLFVFSRLCKDDKDNPSLFDPDIRTMVLKTHLD